MNPNILVSTNGSSGANYLAAIAAAGGRGTACCLPRCGLGFDGLLLTGGGDMDPALFGQENRGSRDIDLARDRAELALLNAFVGAGKPVLAICRGMQVVNVWLGGDLLQDLGPDRVPLHQQAGCDLVHQVRAGEGTLLRRLYGPEFSVNSSHHQGVGRLGRGLRASAWAQDGTAEALEHDRLPLICVQFHPERMTGALARPDAVDGGRIFDRFLALCRGEG